MIYLICFLAVTGLLIAVSAVIPVRSEPGIRARSDVRARLDTLDTVGGALMPVGEARKRPRKPRGRKRQHRLPRPIGALLVLILLWLAFAYVWGPWKALIVLTGALVVLGIAYGLWKTWIMRMVRRQLPDAVRILAQRLRATNSFFAALEAVERSGIQPVAAQFGRVRQDVARGLPEEQALDRFAARVPILETEILAKTIAYQPQKGQRLATALDRIAEVLDGRRRMVGLLDVARGGG